MLTTYTAHLVNPARNASLPALVAPVPDRDEAMRLACAELARATAARDIEEGWTVEIEAIETDA